MARGRQASGRSGGGEMRKTGWWAVVALAFAMLAATPARSVAAESYAAGKAALSRGRTGALITALFYHDPAPGDDSGDLARNHPLNGTSFASANPRQAMNSVERGKVVEFAKSLIYEGGFFPGEIYQLLGYKDVKTARVGRLVGQLDSAGGRKPAPWEAAGRVGRSGMTGVSDHWAMAPGEEGESGLSSPGTLAYLPMLAVVYANYPEDGCEAASQLAILKDDDIRAASAARAALSLLVRILTSDKLDKDAWLRAAASDSRDSETEHDIRMTRVKEWKYLRGEECAMGRLERAVHLWYKGRNYEEIMAEGRRLLRSRESLAFLAGLAGVTYGPESLPNRVIVRGSNDHQLLDLISDLYDLATSEAVLRVGSEPE